MYSLRNKAKKFFEAGRSEFNSQLIKWQEFFEETGEDHHETQNRVQNLESLLEMLQKQLDDMQDKFSQQKEVI